MANAGYADLYAGKLTTAARAVAGVSDGATVSLGMAIGQPPALLAALAGRLRSNDLKRIRLYYKIAMEPLAKSLLAEDVIEKVDAHSFFIGGPDHEIIKRQVKTGKKLLSFVPVNFSQIPRLFEEFIALDTFIVTVSPMDGADFSRWARTMISPRPPRGDASA